MSTSSPNDLFLEADPFGFELVDAPDDLNFSSSAERAPGAVYTTERFAASSAAVSDEEDARAVLIRVKLAALPAAKERYYAVWRVPARFDWDKAVYC